MHLALFDHIAMQIDRDVLYNWSIADNDWNNAMLCSSPTDSFGWDDNNGVYACSNFVYNENARGEIHWHCIADVLKRGFK